MKSISWNCTALAALLVLMSGPAPGQTPAKARTEAPAGDSANGRKLLGKYGCYECHGWEGQGGYAGPRIAPNPLPFTAFVRYIRAPKGVMPPYTEKLLKSEQDLADIYAYLKSRPPAAPQSVLPSH
jgi:mono/diheme cytochrome c family protein